MELPTVGADAPPAESIATPPVAPAVVAVMVARDPGPWFEEAVASLVDQDYPNLSVLVVDAASATEVKPRVGRAAPGAFVRRVEEDLGYGAAANEVLEVVEGAAFYVLCHDDVALAPDAVRRLVEEAYRSNAAVVGPKLVAWDDARRLLQVGMGIDRVGYEVPLVERGELDQAQHDAVRDVFTVPAACMLVRSDLFSEIGGFDEGIDHHLDDVSLCWRARLAGARVIVAPDARVRHRETAGERDDVVDGRRRAARHRLRILLSCYGPLGLVRAVPQILVIHLLEVVYALLAGRREQVGAIVHGWTWNLRRLGELRGARAQVRGFRHVPDREVRRSMARGSARLSQFLRGQIGRSEDRFSGFARQGRDVAGTVSTGTFRGVAGVWAAVAVVLVLGSRHLLTRGVPAVGEMVLFSSSPLDLLREWGSGWRTAGLGSASPAPTAFGLLAGLGTLAVGAMGLLRTVLTLGLLPLGALLAYRLPAPTGLRHAQVACLLVYICNPLPYNALAAGRWGALALYAAAPALAGGLARASRLAPFGQGEQRRTTRVDVVSLGVITALVAALLPAGVAVLAAMALALALGGLLVFSTRGALRLIGVGAGAAVLAVALHLPWSLDFLLPGTPLSAFTGPALPAQPSDLGALLRFEVGPLGSAPLGWALLVAAALPLLIGRDERHAWAVRGWTLAVVSFGLAWAAQRGDLPFALPSPDVLLVPAAVGLALAAAMGVAAFEVDLPGYRFGWRQMASGVAALAVVVATIPVLGAAFDGRWSMPSGDHARSLAFLDAENDEEPFRVLWLGDPRALPLASWDLDDGVAYATTDAGTPGIENLWAGSDDGPTGLLADALDLARSGETARLGRLLAPMGIRYIVVPERLAPAPFATDELPVPAALSATLAAQLDLEPLDVPAGLTVFRNQAVAPLRAELTDDVALPESGGIAESLLLDLSSLPAVLPDEAGRLRWQGPLDDGATVLLSAAHADGWELEVDGQAAELIKPFGWATGFEVETGGDATLRYVTPPVRYALLALQAVVWLWLLRVVVRWRLNPAARPSSEPTS